MSLGVQSLVAAVIAAWSLHQVPSGLAAASSATACALGWALAYPYVRDYGRRGLLVFMATVLTLVAAESLGVVIFPDEAPTGAAFSLAGLILAANTAHIGEGRPQSPTYDTPGWSEDNRFTHTVIAAAFPITCLLFVAWLRGGGARTDPLTAVLEAVLSTSFLALVAGLYRNFNRRESNELLADQPNGNANPQNDLSTPPSPSPSRRNLRRFYEDTWSRVGGTFVAGVIAGGAFVSTLGGLNGFDNRSAIALGLSSGALLLLMLGACGSIVGAAWSWVRRHGVGHRVWRPGVRLRTSIGTVALGVAGSSLWGIGAPIVVRPRFGVTPIIFALAYGAVVSEGLIVNSAHVHGVRLNKGAWFIVAVHYVVVSSATYWLLSTALTSADNHPPRLTEALVAMLTILLGTCLTSMMVGNMLWWSNPYGRITLYAPPACFFQDFALGAGLLCLTAAAPMFLIAHTGGHLSLALIPDLAHLLPLLLIAVFVSGIPNISVGWFKPRPFAGVLRPGTGKLLQDHPERLLKRLARDADAVKDFETRTRRHLKFQAWSLYGFLILGFVMTVLAAAFGKPLP